MLTYHLVLDLLDYHGLTRIEFHCGTFIERLELSGIRSPIGVAFSKFHFAKGLDATATTLHHLSINQSQLAQGLDASNLKLASLLYLGDTDIYGALNLQRSKGDVLSMQHTTVTGETQLYYANYNYISILGPRCNLGTNAAENKQAGVSLFAHRLKIDEQLAVLKCVANGNIVLARAHIADMLLISQTTVKGNVSIVNSNIAAVRINDSEYKKGTNGITVLGRMTITGHMNVTGSSLGDAVISGTQIGGKITLNRSEFDGDVTFARSSGWSEFSAVNAIVNGDLSLTGVSSWTKLDLRRSSILGTIQTDELQSLTHWPNVKVNLRNAEMSAFRFGSDTAFERGGKCALDKSFVDNRFYLDLFGSRYDPRQMDGFLSTDVGCLAEVISSVGGEHAPQPYIYMSERLEDIGRVENADSLRIHERERALVARTGADGLWQWMIGRTTGFGYSPELALAWFAGLVCLGMLYVTLAAGLGVDNWIRRSWKTESVCWLGWLVVFFGLWEGAAWAILGIHLTDAMTGGDATSSTAGVEVAWDHWGFAGLAFFVWIGVGLSLKAPGFRLRTWDERNEVHDEQARTRRRKWWGVIRAGLLYSLDRAIPFLGFDGEHVRWFGVGDQKLNDMPLPLCIYFYAHSALGFGFISLFIAGLTGVLK